MCGDVNVYSRAAKKVTVEVGIPKTSEKICCEWSIETGLDLFSDRSSAAGVIASRREELCVLVNASETHPCSQSFVNYIKAKLGNRKIKVTTRLTQLLSVRLVIACK